MTNLLKLKNSHSRDAFITFNEELHEYYIRNPEYPLIRKQKVKISVTTYIHKLFPEFDADNIICKMMKSSRWEESKYYGMHAYEIKALWEQNRIEAARLGTQMHKNIELFYNSNMNMVNFINNYNIDITPEFQMFINFQSDNKHLKPYRTEWEIFDEDNNIAGSVDMLYENKDGTLDICDWKRCKEIKKENNWEHGRFPIMHLPNTNFWHYSLQLNVYKYILETKYEKTINNMYLICLHPENENYIRYNVENLQNEVHDMFHQM